MFIVHVHYHVYLLTNSQCMQLHVYHVITTNVKQCCHINELACVFLTINICHVSYLARYLNNTRTIKIEIVVTFSVHYGHALNSILIEALNHLYVYIQEIVYAANFRQNSHDIFYTRLGKKLGRTSHHVEMLYQ